MRKLLIRVVTLATASTAVLAPAAPATAAAAQNLSFRPLHYNINGYNWGGYAATGSGFTSVSAKWTEPSASCESTNDLYAPWVGIDGYGTSTVEQTGVATDCSSGRPVDEPWYEMYPANPVYLNTSTYPVSAGDVISASVTYVGSSRFTLKLSDTTRGWTYTTTKTLTSAKRRSAEVIIESPAGSYPDFGTLKFSSAMVNGSSLGSFSPVALDPSSYWGYEAHTSSLSGGTSFTETFLSE